MAKKETTIEGVTQQILDIFAHIRGTVPHVTIDDAIKIYNIYRSGDKQIG